MFNFLASSHSLARQEDEDFQEIKYCLWIEQLCNGRIYVYKYG